MEWRNHHRVKNGLWQMCCVCCEKHKQRVNFYYAKRSDYYYYDMKTKCLRQKLTYFVTSIEGREHLYFSRYNGYTVVVFSFPRETNPYLTVARKISSSYYRCRRHCKVAHECWRWWLGTHGKYYIFKRLLSFNLLWVLWLTQCH